MEISAVALLGRLAAEKTAAAALKLEVSLRRGLICPQRFVAKTNM